MGRHANKYPRPRGVESPKSSLRRRRREQMGLRADIVISFEKWNAERTAMQRFQKQLSIYERNLMAKSCSRKIKRTMDNANRIASELKLSFYKCDYCGGYHLTKALVSNNIQPAIGLPKTAPLQADG